MTDNQNTGSTIGKITYLLLLVTIGRAASPSGVQSKPIKYSEQHLSNEDICHTFKRSVLTLPNSSNSGLIVSPSYVFDRWNQRLKDLKCKFLVKAPKGEHLFAVIQNISFRRNGTECLDYVKFKRKDRSETVKFCGTFDRRRSRSSLEYTEDFNDFPAKNDAHAYGEFDSQGEIETTIFVSKQSTSDDERLDLTIVYTPYKDCEKVDFGDYRTMKYDVCIWREYFCDGYQNCFADICMDEQYCPNEIVSNGTGTKVTIGAVTTILLCFVIFLMGLWICRRHKKLCWSPDCAGPSPNDNRMSTADRDSTNLNNPSVAVAPMLEIAVLPSALDKDLPPSYDSLFPEQANPSTT